MHVGATGSGSPNLDPPARLSGPAGAATHLTGEPRGDSDPSVGRFISAVGQAAAGDSVTTQLANPQILKLLDRIEQPRLAQDPALAEGLMNVAVSAATRGDVGQALGALSALVTLNPERGHTFINTEPALAPLRVETANLLEHLTFNAKAEAEHTLTAASLALGINGHASARTGEPDPQAVLAIAVRFFESGQHINFVRAGELGQSVLAYYGAPVMDGVSPAWMPRPQGNRIRQATLRSESPHWLQAVWRRTPLLVLLAGWLILGIAGALLSLLAGEPLSAAAVETWAVGFLGLVGFQFYASIRNARF